MTCCDCCWRKYSWVSKLQLSFVHGLLMMLVSLVSWRIAPRQLASAEVNSKHLSSVSPQEILNLLTKHKLLTDQLVKVRWDKNEPIEVNLDERDEAKSRVEGAMFSGESWFCWSGNNLWKQFFILAWGWACSSLLYLEGFWSIRPLSISLKAALTCSNLTFKYWIQSFCINGSNDKISTI